MPSPTIIAEKRTGMFQALGSDSVWDKTSITTLIFALFDAIAKEMANFQEDVDASRADVHLGTINRGTFLQRMWGDMLGENIQGDITILQNIQVWRNLLKRLVYGVQLDGILYKPTTTNNIKQTILDYSLVPECAVFEFWNNKGSFVGASIINNALTWNDADHSWNEGLHSVWLDISTLRALAYLVTGFQIFPVINDYTRDTSLITYAANILKPYHNLIGFCWMSDLVTMPVGTSLDVAYVQLGIGSGAGPGCTTPIIDVPAFVDSIEPTRRVSAVPTSLKRALGIVTISALPAAAEITEMCLLDGSSNPIAGSYRTVPAIHKEANKPLAAGFYYLEQ